MTGLMNNKRLLDENSALQEEGVAYLSNEKLWPRLRD